MNRSIDLHFPSSDVTIIAEPGRYYVASAYTLACQVYSKREVFENGKFSSMKYYINDGIYGSFDCVLYQQLVPMDHEILHPLTLKSANENVFKSSICGPTMDSIDMVSPNTC